MSKPRIVVAGVGRERAGALLARLLTSDSYEILVLSTDAPHFRPFRCAMLLLLPLPAGSRTELRRSLRALTYRKGLVVAYGHDPTIRSGCKGFNLRFRWFDSGHPWPGVHSSDLPVLGAARIAHELGVNQLTIKQVLS